MEQKKEVNIVVIGNIFKFFSILSVFFMFGCIGIIFYDRQPALAFSLMAIFAILAILSFVTGDGLLKHRKWSLNTAIILSVVFGLLFILPFVATFFLTRPKVKALFSPAKPKA